MNEAAARAKELSSALKELHRALIRSEIGDDPRLQNPYTMLFALIGDPRFAWMSGLSGLVARIDHAVAKGEIDEPGAFEAFRAESAALLEGEGDAASAQFRLRHIMALQNHPDVGLATGALRSRLAPRRQ